MQRILLTYNRHETSEAIRLFRSEFARLDYSISVGAGSLLQPGAKPADQIRAKLPQFVAVLFIVGPQGLDAKRPGELYTVREAMQQGLPVIAVIADGAALPAEFSQLPVVSISPTTLEAAIHYVQRLIRRLRPDASPGVESPELDENLDALAKLDLDEESDAPAASGGGDSTEDLSSDEIDALLNSTAFDYGESEQLDRIADLPGSEEGTGELDDLDLGGGYDLGGDLDARDTGGTDLPEQGSGAGTLHQEEIDALLSAVSSGEVDPDDYATTADGPPGSEPVAFAAYCPSQFDFETRQSLFVYAHLANDSKIVSAIEKDVDRLRDELGGSVPDRRPARDVAELRAGTQVTIVPECEDVLFDPPELTKRWRGDWTRFEFEILLPEVTEPDAAPATHPGRTQPGEIALVRISVRVAGIEIAHIKCSAIFVSAQDTSDNPLAAAKALGRSKAQLYQKIFVSYSRRDFQVTRSYQAAQLALGNEVFVDSESIRAGENWQAALARAIDSADVMQLFWSNHSAKSPNVRDEWQYALQHRCPTDRCVSFIRPVYWRTPMPEVPKELEHLHFKHLDLEST